ncbi:1337_t:CDS:2, partial [Racocetra persica]
VFGYFQQFTAQQSTSQQFTSQQSDSQQFISQQSISQQSISQQSIQFSQQISFQQTSISQIFSQFTHQDSQQFIINMFEDFAFDNTIIEEFNNSTDLSIKFVQEEFIDIIINWIVGDDQSFRVVKKSSFKKIIEYLRITTDNASNNNTMFSYFANYCTYDEIYFDINNQRVRCLAHIINLAVQDLLKNLKAEGPNENKILLNNEDIISTVKKLRKIIIIIYSLSQCREKFFQYNPNNLELIFDIKTRWNSTYYMLKRPINIITKLDKEIENYSLSQEEWKQITIIQNLLE